MSGSTWRPARALLAGLWAGGLWTIAAIAAPASFAVLARPDAGRFVGRVFAQEAAAGLVIAILAAEPEPDLRVALVQSDQRKAAFLSTVVRKTGLRADIRYFRDLQDADPDGEFDIDLGEVNYWRAVGGITFKF